MAIGSRVNQSSFLKLLQRISSRYLAGKNCVQIRKIDPQPQKHRRILEYSSTKIHPFQELGVKSWLSATWNRKQAGRQNYFSSSDPRQDISRDIQGQIFSHFTLRVSDILSGILPDTYSNIYSGIFSGSWGPAVPTELGSWRLRSGTAPCDRELARREEDEDEDEKRTPLMNLAGGEKPWHIGVKKELAQTYQVCYLAELVNLVGRCLTTKRNNH